MSRTRKDPPRLTRAERQERTRLALLDAAAEVVTERGLHGASVEAIAARAGFTRGAFYSNFRSREELFVELLQQRVYRRYAEMAMQVISGERIDTPRESGERLAAIQGEPEAPAMFHLWLELLAQAGRDPDLREMAAGFWRGNAMLIEQALAAAEEAHGTELNVDARALAAAAIALDVGLGIQHFVDPERVPLSVWPDAFEALYRGLEDAQTSRSK
jgi:AcrR family transcriptional regulator